MNFRSLKKEFFYIRKAFFTHRKGFEYLNNKYKLSKSILSVNHPLDKPETHPQLAVHILSSNSDLTMLCWSLLSFYFYSKIVGKLYIHDDGSFENRDYKVIKKLFPNAQIVDSEKFLEENQADVSQYLSIFKYRRDEISMVWRKKLIDPYYVGKEPWKLILDSDVLWFNNPIDIASAMNKKASCMMALLPGSPVKFKDGTMLLPEFAQYNSGIVLYCKDNFNLEKLSDYLDKVNFAYAPNKHFIEQAGYASCLNNLVALPQEKYNVKGELHNFTVAKHYTSPRRVLFYTEGLPKLQKLLV